MVTQALYRRWRSRTFAEIIGQEHVTQTLLNALRAGRIAHAYLFSGPRGTGKTTTARVLARAVNCLDPQDGEPCNRCTICCSLNEGRSLDLVEIDAASNRGIDDVRALRERIAFAPTESRYKVYVVDEVHMLTNEAFNALLKTLEEPPPHAIFVLATTEPHKIPATVLSRCQRFDFRRISLSNLKKKLELIRAKEGVHIQPVALEAIARYAAGSFRDAESLLDQLVSYGVEEVTVEDIRRVLGSAPEQIISGIVRAALDRNVSAGLALINEALDSGVEARQLTREVLEHLRGVLLVKNQGASLLNSTAEMLQEMTAQAETVSLPRLLATIRLFNEAANHLKKGVHAQLPLEMALVEAAGIDQPAEPARSGLSDHVVAQPKALAPGPDAPVSTTSKLNTVAEKATSSAPSDEPAATRSTSSQGAVAPVFAADTTAGRAPTSGQKPDLTLAWLQQSWGDLLRAVRPKSRVVEALLKSCEPLSVQDCLVTLGFYHAFHKERMEEDKNHTVVEQVLSELGGQPMRVKFTVVAGDREGKEQQNEASRREKLLNNPVVHEAIERYGARIVDIQ